MTKNHASRDPEDPELTESATVCADVLRATADRWRTRLEAGQVVTSSVAGTKALVGALEQAAALVERAPASGPPMREEPAGDERLRTLIDAVRDYAIFMVDPEGHVRSWNRGAEQILGYSAEHIIGKHVATFYLPEESESGVAARELARAATEGRHEREGWRVRQDGSRFWASVVTTARRDDDGTLRGFATVTRDITAQHEAAEALRQSEERFRVMVEAVQDYAIFMLDPEGRIATWNVGAERIKGYRADEVIGKHVSTFYTEEDRARRHPEHVLHMAATHGRYAEEGWRVRKDGSHFFASIVMTALRDPRGRLLGFAKVTRDMTEPRRSEELRDMLRARDEFLSVASHELKTPVSALQLQLESLAEILDAAPLSEEHPDLKRRVDRAVHSATRLARLIEALLDVSRIAIGQFELELAPIDVREVVAGAAEQLRPEAKRSGSDLSIALPSEPVLGCWDRSRIEQMLFNVISNAMKFGRGAPIEVTLLPHPESITICVIDHGIGIAPEDLERIFDRFERAVTSRHYGGLGLGLYITMQIAEAHGGTVRASSNERGTQFDIVLPRAPVPPGTDGGTA